MDPRTQELIERYHIKVPTYSEEDFVTLKHMLEPFFQANEEKRQTDRALKRFLRAFIRPDEAHDAIIRYLEWRHKFQVDHISGDDPIIIEEHGLQRCIFTGKRDPFGRPVVIVQVRYHDKNTRNLQHLTKYLVYAMEELGRECNEDVIDSICVIFNFEGFSFRNMDYSFVKRLIWVLQNCYPERLGVCLLIHAPWIFYGCWAIIRPWLNEVTASKVIFIKCREELSDFVDLESLPIELYNY